MRMGLADFTRRTLRHGFEEVESALVMLDEVETGVHKERGVSRSAGTVIHEENIVVQGFEVIEGVFEPD